MPIFILSCLAIGYLTVNAHPLLAYLLKPVVVQIGSAVLAIGFAGVLIEKPAYINWRDVFASAALFVWLAYWRRFFEADAPMFVYFPYYLAFIALFTVVFFIGQRKNFDRETLEIMQKIAQRRRSISIVTMTLVLVSLVWTEHFLLYPVVMTLFVIEFSFLECVRQDD